jgi:hypothetical protein
MKTAANNSFFTNPGNCDLLQSAYAHRGALRYEVKDYES